MNSNNVPNNLRLLSVVAHPHDITYTLGTSAHHIERGDSVTAVSITDGVTTHDTELEAELRKPAEQRRGEILQRSREEQAEKKKKEMIEVCGIFGITDVHVLPFADNPIVSTKELRRSLMKIFYETRPHIVITQPPFNPSYKSHTSTFPHDHALTGQIVNEVIQSISQADQLSKEIPHTVAQLYYIGVEFGWNEIDLFVDITDQAQKRIKAEELYHTQGHTSEFAHKRIEVFAGHAGWWSHCSYAEPFIRSRGQGSNYLTVTENDLLDAQRTGPDVHERLSYMTGSDLT